MAASFSELTLSPEQEKAFRKENQHLLKIIRCKNARNNLKGMQLVRFGNTLLVAIDRRQSEPFSEGASSRVYKAHPLKSTGEIDFQVELIAKIIKKNEERVVSIDSIAHKEQIEIETKNGNFLFSSRISNIRKVLKGEIFEENIILMSKIPGESLEKLIAEGGLKYLKPQERLQLAINVIEVYQILHQEGIFHGDVKAENIVIDLGTLIGMPIDLDPSHRTDLTKAPEEELSEISDGYSLVQDILMAIFSGMRLQKNEEGEITNQLLIQVAIQQNFKHGPFSIENAYTWAIDDVWRGMHAEKPEDRMPLEKAKNILKEALAGLDPVLIDDKAIKAYQEQLSILEQVLKDSEHSLPVASTAGSKLSQPTPSRFGLFPRPHIQPPATIGRIKEGISAAFSRAGFV